SLSEALGVISTINGVRCPVVTFCNGQAIGPAAIIAAHGLKGYRVATPTARFSFKGINSPVKGQFGTEFDSSLALLAEILARDTRKSNDQVFQWFKEGAQFASQEALANGLIDVVSSRPLLPKFG